MVAARHQMAADLIGFRLAAEPDIDVVGTTCKPGEVAAETQRLRPDVTLIDSALVSGNLAMVCRQISSRATRVAALAPSTADRTILQAIEAGCTSFAVLGRSDVEIVAAVRSAHAGTPHMDPDLLNGLVHHLDRTQPPNELTNRELEVLTLVAQGLVNAKIAAELDLSLNTIRHHVQSILTKLGVHTKLQAVTLALRDELITLDN